MLGRNAFFPDKGNRSFTSSGQSILPAKAKSVPLGRYQRRLLLTLRLWRSVVLVDWVKETGNAPPDYVMPIWDEYMAFHQSRDVDRAHQQLHASHYSYLDPDEARFVRPEMIRTFCIAGQPDEIIERLHELEAEGLNAINFSFPLERRYRMIEDFATRVIHRM